MRCEFVGDENTVQGRLVPCHRPPIVKMRPRGIEVLYLGKAVVCEHHMKVMLSARVQVAGRDWQIEHFL